MPGVIRAVRQMGRAAAGTFSCDIEGESRTDCRYVEIGKRATIGLRERVEGAYGSSLT